MVIVLQMDMLKVINDSGKTEKIRPKTHPLYLCLRISWCDILILQPSPPHNEFSDDSKTEKKQR